uniref:Uncharacterized protein n=1 Tax=Anguilla anguilla TaxID=7936 RepID=A0A0E9TVA8_ANGAN
MTCVLGLCYVRLTLSQSYIRAAWETLSTVYSYAWDCTAETSQLTE